jgi:21S rRNA (uridine2791-2'-O)-methyltransferase
VRKQAVFHEEDELGEEDDEKTSMTEDEFDEATRGYIDMERHDSAADAPSLDEPSSASTPDEEQNGGPKGRISKKINEEASGRMVDLVLSDMSAPWPLIDRSVLWKRSLSDPYYRMMNTSGMSFRDHAGSMVSKEIPTAPLKRTDALQDLCYAALQFCVDTLRPGGHFVCKFYQGSEDKLLEKRLKKLFAIVHREKPESSRSVSPDRDVIAL